MKTLGMIDSDLRFENGDFVMVDGVEEVTQCIEIDLGTNVKEWFLNELAGADHSKILDKSTDEEARAEIFRVLGNEPRIAEINSVEIKSDTQQRVRAIYFDVTLIDGAHLVKEVGVGGIRP